MKLSWTKKAVKVSVPGTGSSWLSRWSRRVQRRLRLPNEATAWITVLPPQRSLRLTSAPESNRSYKAETHFDDFYFDEDIYSSTYKPEFDQALLTHTATFSDK